MDSIFIGTIMPFPYNFVPRGWMACNGQLLPIQQYSTLFALIGTTYGGNGTSNFALPNINGSTVRVVAGQGQGPGLSDYTIGESLGTDTVTLTSAEIPPHNHPMTLYRGTTNVATPTAGATLADPGMVGFLPPGSMPQTPLAPQTIGPAGSGQPHSNDQPTLQLFYCIAYVGDFPSFQ
jgi:microcystin-dependent protein